MADISNNNIYKKKPCASYLYCGINLTIGVRFIAFLGMAISVLLMSVLLNDKQQKNYNASRYTALALGLDWQHFHINANASEHADPEGHFISLIVIFYSTLYLITNLLLLFASVALNKLLAYPWLICELVSWFSKLGALIYHLQSEPEIISKTFIIGSIFYIVIVLWWWIVVFATQLTWKTAVNWDDTMSIKNGSFFMRPSEINLAGVPTYLRKPSLIDSPEPYKPNEAYCSI